MSVINPNEGNPTQPAGGTESPTSSPSGSASQPLPEYVKTLQSQIEQINTNIKGLQKGTDKQIGQVRDNLKRILELKDQGLNEEQIKRELWIDQQINQPETAQVQPPAGSGQVNTGLDVEAGLKRLQFPENDPTLAALKIKHANNPQELLLAAAELRLAQATSPSPSPATLLSQSGGSTNVSADTSVQVARLQELLKAPSKNRAEIAELEKTLNERGWH